MLGNEILQSEDVPNNEFPQKLFTLKMLSATLLVLSNVSLYM